MQRCDRDEADVHERTHRARAIDVFIEIYCVTVSLNTATVVPLDPSAKPVTGLTNRTSCVPAGTVASALIAKTRVMFVPEVCVLVWSTRMPPYCRLMVSEPPMMSPPVAEKTTVVEVVTPRATVAPEGVATAVTF